MAVLNRKNKRKEPYAKSITENSVHSSDSVEHAKEEIELWFPGL